jgi:RAD51-like protein 2
MSTSTASHKLSHLPLRPSTLSTLERRGFVSTGELNASKRNGGMSNLAAELGCSLAEAASLMREVDSAVSSVCPTAQHKQSATALSLISKLKTTNRTIVSFSKSVDSMLGGGIAKGEVTEIVGLPGVGKTQLCMQLCVDARLPTAFGGVQGDAVYLDTEGSFSPERCFTMAKALVEHIHGTVKRRNQALPIPDWFRAENILAGIHVYRVHDEASQTATIYALPAFLKQRAEMGSPVRLVIVDSIAFHYRCTPTSSDYMARTRSLTNIAAFLADLATQFDVAVVCINQMTTKVENDSSKLVPALGESWGHATTTRILLSQAGQDSSIRRCTLVKSPHKAAGSALYQIREAGIRDPIQVTPTAASITTTADYTAAKRPRVN